MSGTKNALWQALHDVAPNVDAPIPNKSFSYAASGGKTAAICPKQITGQS
jgi:hypothetical protein